MVALLAAPGDYLVEGQSLVRLEPVDAHAAAVEQQAEIDLDAIRPDLQKVIDRHAPTLDASRAAAVAKRHAQGSRTARENIADLCDLQRTGNFSEYGALAIAAQTRRRSLEDLIANTPADGMVTGIGSVNARQFGPEKSRCVVMAYDYTVLAGTQGMRNHQKTDRMLGIAHQLRLPVVLFAEGGGGRPGDTDMPIVAGLQQPHLRQFAALSGKVPVVGIVHGPLLRRQRGAAGLQRRDHRHPRQQHRHGRPGHDRRRRPGHVRARADRPERGAVAATA